MKLLRYSFLFFTLVLTTNISAQPWKTYPYQIEGSKISFPQDEGRHSDEPVEWWYTIGHLTSESGRNFSYMLTYFYANISIYDGFRILNITDDDTGEFYSETLPLTYSTLATDSLNIVAKIGTIPYAPTSIETWANKLDNTGAAIPFDYVLSAKSAKGGLNLEFSALKPPLILGDDGYFPQGASNYTYYYSQTLNSVTGTLTFNTTTENVTGTSWIDRQYGTFNPYNAENPDEREDYEWFAIQLSNGMDINFWNLFTVDYRLPNTAAYKNMSVFVDDNNQYTTTDFKLERLAFYTTADLQSCYAQKWRLSSPTNNIDLTITTQHNDSEVLWPFRFYEGSTTIEGTINNTPVTGRGFAELLHSYQQPELHLSSPSEDKWDPSIPITWNETTPDEGRSLRYNLWYSIDGAATYELITEGLSDTMYIWDGQPIKDDDLCWFKIEGYSIDSTLSDEIISSNAFKVSTLSTKQNLSNTKNKFEVKIFPNPATEELRLQFTSAEHQFKTYEILNLSGKTIKKGALHSGSTTEIDTKKIKQGIYIIRLNSELKSTSKKFSIE